MVTAADEVKGKGDSDIEGGIAKWLDEVKDHRN